MEGIFNIFGAHDPVKTVGAVPRLPAAKGAQTQQGLLPGKQSLSNENSNLKEKKVLGDVGNKIKGLNKKLEKNSTDNYIKPSVECKSTLKVSHKTDFQGNETPEQKTVQDNSKVSSHLLWENSDLAKWPAVEIQGPSFWDDDDYDSIWPKTERPAVEDFRNAAKIWDIGMKCTEKHSRPPSPLSIDSDDNMDFCLDIPEIKSDLVLEDVSVQFPWEI